MTNLHIRTYQPANFNAVFNLHNVALEATGAHVGNGNWDSDLLNIESVYLQDNGSFLVGILDNQIIAMGALRKITKEIYEIKRLRVLLQFQRRGFGQQILDALEKEAIQRGYKLMRSDTTILQTASQALHLKNGCKEIRRTKEGHPFETIFYEKHLA